MPARSFGPKKTGPDLSWADEGIEDPNDRDNRDVSPPSNVPGPTFPPRDHKNIIRTPKPLSATEKRAVSAQLKFRQRCREGPLFTVLDKNSLLVDGVSRKSTEAKRRGFDPFEQQDRFSTRHLKKARTEPDLGPAGRGDYGYTLAMFPEELWGVLDPDQKLPDWKLVNEHSVAYAGLPGRRKAVSERKKRKKALAYDKIDSQVELPNGETAEQQDDEDEDPIAGNRKKRKTKDKLGRQDAEKRGLDAEDDVDAEANADENDDEAAEDEPEDSDFSEDSDQNDYDAEQYFDNGDDDDGADEEYGGGDDY